MLKTLAPSSPLRIVTAIAMLVASANSGALARSADEIERELGTAGAF